MKHKSVLCERWLWCVITITTSAQRNCRAWQNKSIVNPILLNQSKNNCVYVLHEDGTKWTKWNILQNFQGQKYVDTWTLCPCHFLSSKSWALISHYDTLLFWEGFAQDFGTWLQGLAPSPVLPGSNTDDGLAYSWCSRSSQRCYFKPKQGKAFLYGPGFVQWGLTGKDPPHTVAT